jgi:hypothetical protein
VGDEEMAGRERRVERNVLPDLYKGFGRLHNTLILKMETALSAETLETHQHSNLLIPESRSLNVTPDAKN